ncbi:hypothetical protein B296_00034007 [Ensete ventricosum]|uniref:protein-serine/threonine phosphatase n=1 Tax=Ensete ventricosum TaxID=4639 RepID=A0A427A9I3_ENSVE|nr:hypothetical protein B296_00034007 [Ensete ventricosum]
MGGCFSSASSKNQASLERKECEEEAVEVCVEQGGDGLSPDEERRRRRRIASSLYSHRGDKGLNQDAAILCKVLAAASSKLTIYILVSGFGHTVSRVVRDYLPALLLSERNALPLAQEDDEFTDGNDTSSTDGEEVLDVWKEACINAYRTMDEELKVRPSLDCSFSGTTAVSIIKQVRHDSRSKHFFLCVGMDTLSWITNHLPSPGGRSDHCQPWGLEGCHGNRIRGGGGGSPRGDSADDRPEAQHTS